MKFLLIPENNSLSHIVKGLALYESLVFRGHEVQLAVSNRHSYFLDKTGIPHCLLPDIQEADGSGFPTIEWFRKPERILETIKSELDLIFRYKPDRILGIFRFTVKASAFMAGIPCDSLICGCMLPDAGETLGFADGEPDSLFQREILNGFYRYGAAKMNTALQAFGLTPITDIRSMLKGEQTYLWDFPEFFHRPHDAQTKYVGPISWNRWPYDEVNIEGIQGVSRPIALVSFGTCMKDSDIFERITRILTDMGYFVVLAAGGQKDVVSCFSSYRYVAACEFAPLEKLLPLASLLVTHGGQLSIFEALQHRIPVVVIPFQPEQAHNGVCLERMGCGVRLIPSTLFQGNSRVYGDAFNRMTDGDIKQKISHLVNDGKTGKKLAEAKIILDGYKGAETIADFIGTSV